MRLALPLPWLEVRYHRTVHRDSLGARGKRLRQEDQAEVLPTGRARRRAVDLYGATGAQAAIAGMGIRHGRARAALRVQAAAGVQLAPSDGRRHRFEPRLLAAPRQ